MNARRLTILSVLIVSLSLVGLAWWLTPDIVEQHFAPDGTINDATRAQIALFRVGLCCMAALLPLLSTLLWILRKPFLRDFRASAARREEQSCESLRCGNGRQQGQDRTPNPHGSVDCRCGWR